MTSPRYNIILRLLFTCLLFSLLPIAAISQKYYTKNGSISFFSKTPIEDISARNNQVMSVLNTQNGELQFSLLVKNFQFKKALMQEHFNENYLESERFPKATFKGTVSNISSVNLSADGAYKVSVAGDLTIHGITKNTTAEGTLTIKGGHIWGESRFIVKPADYNISIPKVVRENIAETIEVTVSCNYDQKM